MNSPEEVSLIDVIPSAKTESPERPEKEFESEFLYGKEETQALSTLGQLVLINSMLIL